MQRLSGSLREESFPFELFSQQLSGMFPGMSIFPLLCFLSYANFFCSSGIIRETIELSDVTRQLCDSQFDFPDEFKQLRNQYQIQCSSPAEIKPNDSDPGLHIDQLIKAYDTLVLCPDETPSPPVSPHSFGALCLDLLPAPPSVPSQPPLPPSASSFNNLSITSKNLLITVRGSPLVPRPSPPPFSAPNLAVLVEITNADLTVSEKIAVEKGCQLERQIAWFLFRPAPHRIYPFLFFSHAPSSRFNVSCKGDFYTMNFGRFFTQFFSRYPRCFPLLKTYFRKQLFVPLIKKDTEL